MPGSEDPTDKRVRRRCALRLRVDLRSLEEQERLDILSGNGFPELDSEGLAMTRPRLGLQRTESLDLSASGLRIKVGPLDAVQAGGAVSMDLHLPGDRRVIRLLGDVIWRADQGGEAVAGLRIAALESEGMQRLLITLEPKPNA